MPGVTAGIICRRDLSHRRGNGYTQVTKFQNSIVWARWARFLRRSQWLIWINLVVWARIGSMLIVLSYASYNLLVGCRIV
jgi:hypothetical protein